MKNGGACATTWHQRVAMLDWLELPPGIKLKVILGQSTNDLKLVVAGSKVSKAAGFKDMADYVNQKCGTKWTGNNAQSRFKAWLKNFKEIKRQYMDCNGEKYCLSQDDFRKKVYTIEAKLDNDCPFYNRMDNLFGERQNVVPSYVMQSTEFSQFTETQFTTYDDLSSDEDGEDNEEIEIIKIALKTLSVYFSTFP
jgi:hypothetical protein